MQKNGRMNMILLVYLFLFGIALIGCLYVFVSWRSHRSPGLPYAYADCIAGRVPSDGKRVVVLGDSLTHGTMSHNWLVDLQAQYAGEYVFINQGWNGDLAWNARQKLDDVVGCQPDIIAIFVGGNDALATFSPVWTENFIKNKQLPQTPTADWYRQNLEGIVTQLQQQTDAELVLLTLTLFGEDLDSPENVPFSDYSEIVRSTGRTFGVPVLPIHTNMKKMVESAELNEAKSCSPADWDGYRRQIKWGIIRYHFLFQTWDQISASRGYIGQIDCVHLNSRAAGVIAATFSEWLDTKR